MECASPCWMIAMKYIIEACALLAVQWPTSICLESMCDFCKFKSCTVMLSTWYTLSKRYSLWRVNTLQLSRCVISSYSETHWRIQTGIFSSYICWCMYVCTCIPCPCPMFIELYIVQRPTSCVLAIGFVCHPNPICYLNTPKLLFSRLTSVR